MLSNLIGLLKARKVGGIAHLVCQRFWYRGPQIPTSIPDMRKIEIPPNDQCGHVNLAKPVIILTSVEIATDVWGAKRLREHLVEQLSARPRNAVLWRERALDVPALR